MRFIFKRKYTLSFLVFALLISIAVAFFFIGPKFIDKDEQFFTNVLIASIADITLITIFILGLYRVNYYLYHDHLEIRRSFFKSIKLNYSQIKEFTEYPNDSIFFIFGKRPSFKIKYEQGNKIKKYRIRIANHELFRLVMENEKKIHLTTNN